MGSNTRPSEAARSESGYTTPVSVTETAVTDVDLEKSSKKKAEHEADEIPELPFRQLIISIVGCCVALFLAAMDTTIVSTAMPKIASEFHQLELVSWIATSYILCFNSFQPLFGKFANIFGSKIVLLVSVVFFLITSALCGVAQNMAMLIAFRALQGIGGSGVFSMVMIAISEITPLHKRGKYQGFINSVFAISSVAGPLLGGALTDKVSWRWTFYINLPFGAVAFLIIFIYLRMPAPRGSFRSKIKRVDFIGTILVVVASSCLLVALTLAGSETGWGTAEVIAPLVIAVVFFAVLVWVEIKVVPEPIFPPHLFRVRTVLSVYISNFFFGLTFFSLVYYLPMYYQSVRGDSATMSGVRMIPMQMAICAVGTVIGFLISYTQSYRWFLRLGTALISVGVGIFLLLDAHSSEAALYGIPVVAGLGAGNIFTTAVIAIQSAVPFRDLAVSTSLGNYSRVFGGVIGVAVCAMILNTHLSGCLPAVLPPDVAKLASQSIEVLHEPGRLTDQQRDMAIECYVQGIHMIWRVLTPIACMSFLATWFVLAHKLKRPAAGKETKSGEQEEEKAEEGLDEIVVATEGNMDSVGGQTSQDTSSGDREEVIEQEEAEKEKGDKNDLSSI
ncbi:uncharacterized protein VTP21DRAFT_2956 [Calcarisporiella thermophila]|uniref:uncharacterized protein n=1 Tax=Calcarisporiella thermophila TaxID=911321 RepID=UPI003741FFEA